jgi:hypothetical protein
MKSGVMQVPADGAGTGHGLLALGQFQSDHLGAPAGMAAADLAQLADCWSRGSLGLGASAHGVVGSDAVVATLGEAGEEPLDGADGQPELARHIGGVGAVTPALKKGSGEWEQERPVAYRPPSKEFGPTPPDHPADAQTRSE